MTNLQTVLQQLEAAETFVRDTREGRESLYSATDVIAGLAYAREILLGEDIDFPCGCEIRLITGVRMLAACDEHMS